MSGSYFYIIVLSFASGIFFRSFAFVSLPVTVWLLVLAVGLGVIWRRQSRTLTAPNLITISLIITATCVGMLRFSVAESLLEDTVLSSQVGQTITLTGQVVREPDIRSKTTQLTIKTKDTLVLVSTDRHSPISYGDQIEVNGKLEKPETFTTDFGRTFDYAGYLAARGVTHTMSFTTPIVISRTNGNPVISTLLYVKHIFMQAIESVIPEPYVGLGEGLLLGVKQALGDELEAAFRTTGIIHIVVLSGANVMLVVAFIRYTLSLILPLRPRIIVGIMAIIAFALLVGLSATVVRASIMAVLFLVAGSMSRQYDILRALFFAGALMLVLNPYLLVYDIGFQLSFMATLGLLLVAPHFEVMLASVPARIGIRSFLMATIATQIAVAPLLLFQIGEFSLVAVAVNVLVLPMVPVAMLLTFITGLVAMISTPLALPIAYAAYISLAYIIELALWFAHLPFAAVTVQTFPFWLVPLMYVGLAGILYWRMRRLATGEIEEITLPVELSKWTIEVESEDGRGQSPRPSLNPTTTLPPVDKTPIFFR